MGLTLLLWVCALSSVHTILYVLLKNIIIKNFIYVAVIDDKQKEALPEHETQLSSIRWHLSEGLYSMQS